MTYHLALHADTPLLTHQNDKHQDCFVDTQGRLVPVLNYGNLMGDGVRLGSFGYHEDTRFEFLHWPQGIKAGRVTRGTWIKRASARTIASMLQADTGARSEAQWRSRPAAGPLGGRGSRKGRYLVRRFLPSVLVATDAPYPFGPPYQRMSRVVELLEPLLWKPRAGAKVWDKHLKNDWNRTPALRLTRHVLVERYGEAEVKHLYQVLRSLGCDVPERTGDEKDRRIYVSGDMSGWPWQGDRTKEWLAGRTPTPRMRDTGDGGMWLNDAAPMPETEFLEFELDGDPATGILTDRFVGLFP